jgi:hypothetical protein
VPWFRLDDRFHSHPKIITAGNEATGLYVRCGTYAAEHLTDGFVPENIAVLYGASQIRSRGDAGASGAESLADTLVRVKLWRRVRGGWKMRDYLEYNPSKEAVDNERKAAAERQRRRREDLLSRRDTAVSHTTPTRPVPKNGSVGTGTERRPAATAPKPDLSHSSNGAATRQPPPFAEAQKRALNPEDTR